MPSQTNGVGFDNDAKAPSSQNTGGAKKGSSERQSLMPVTIKQLQMASQAHQDDIFKVDNRELTQITIVGLITKCDEKSTNLTYTIDDGTGMIDARIWVDAEDSDMFAARRAQWREGVYVRIIGTLRSFNNVKSIVAFTIKPIVDFNEMTYHYIEVVHVHLQNSHGPTQTNGGESTPMKTEKPTVRGGNAPIAQADNLQYQSNPGDDPNFSPCQNAVRNYMNMPSGEMGHAIQDCIGALKSFSETDIRAAIDFLSQEGHLYSTVDDEHFKSTTEE